MYQDEKEELGRRMKDTKVSISLASDLVDHIRGWNTTHEAQGKTWPITVLVRLRAHNGTLYEITEPHFVVAVTRHTKELYYYTVVSDAIVTQLKKANGYEEKMKVLVHDDPTNYITTEVVQS